MQSLPAALCHDMSPIGLFNLFEPAQLRGQESAHARGHICSWSGLPSQGEGR